jgi:adenylate kinase
MINLIIFGPPGAGKGTQAKKIAEKYSLVHLSTGDIFRSNIKQETELGKLAKSYIDDGNLVPDDVTIKMLESEVNKNPNAKGFIFDGFPRTANQAIALDSFLENKSQEITLMLALKVGDEELHKRLKKRAQDSGRSDDTDSDIIKNRIEVYKRETEPVAEHYETQGKYEEVEGVGEIDQISQRLYAAIDKHGE